MQAISCVLALLAGLILWITIFSLMKFGGPLAGPSGTSDFVSLLLPIAVLAIPCSIKLFLAARPALASWFLALAPLFGLFSAALTVGIGYNLPFPDTWSESSRSAVVSLMIYVPVALIWLWLSRNAVSPQVPKDS